MANIVIIYYKANRIDVKYSYYLSVLIHSIALLFVATFYSFFKKDND